MRIGVVDLDTSHPGSWLPIIRELGHEVVAVWDGGTVFRPGYAERFAAEHGIAVAAQTLAEVAELADAAIIHSCDWDLHLARMEPLVEAGKPILIDKPLAGNVRDLRRIVELAASGHRICGGSSLRFNFDVARLLAQPLDERGCPQTVFAGCGIDDFNYGIHAYALLWSIMGSGAEAVRHLGVNGQHKIEVAWPEGRRGYLCVGETSGWLPFYATIVTERCVHQITADSTTLYRALLEKCLPYMAGETDEPPLSPAALIEPELAAIAAQESKRRRGRAVRLEDLAEDGFAYDGAAFAAGYRKLRGDY
ncbi:MAG TPA: Gfo/Idh/MocA family oxidoreductase [Armatimonadota bacterium]|nr:Gfo/Idh/MocA family oxidoreductase [Armatimonadota bacterium]